jgi:inosine triphosphate pyrophosphatase
LQIPILIDDGSLCYNAYKGLPGPYIKWFLKKIGTKGLAKMLEPFEDKTGYALCILVYMSKDIQIPQLFIGKVNGKIVDPRGVEDCGWYSIFQPNGY